MIFNDNILSLTEVAKHFMLAIQIANGLVNKECEAKYPKEWVDKIEDHVLIFYVSNPEFFFDDEVITEMSVMDVVKRNQKYKEYNGWKELDNVLNKYYAFLCS